MLVVTVAAIASWLCWIAWPWYQERLLVSELRQRILDAETSADGGKAFKDLVTRVQRNSLRRLVNDPDTGIALKATFELHKLKTADYQRMKPIHAQAFLDAFRERTGLIPPDWWARNLPEVNPWIDHTSLSQATTKTVDDTVIIAFDNRELRIESSLYAKMCENYVTFTGLGSEGYFAVTVFARIETSRSFLAICEENFGSKFDLYCIDSQSGQILWQSKVWALGADNLWAGSGSWSHAAQLTLSEDKNQIIVWGAGRGGSYVEAFDTSNGKNAFRFCSEYWYAW